MSLISSVCIHVPYFFKILSKYLLSLIQIIVHCISNAIINSLTQLQISVRINVKYMPDLNCHCCLVVF